ncbi:hypothetical protein [Catellatospora methionotrophica]|nr:hypothetical protein [Catellatospora methionotrophica]
MLRRMILLGVATLLLAACGTGSPAADRSAATSSDMGAMQGRWWTWAAAEPEASNPVADPTGEFCALNQPADVWFLAGTFGTRAQRACTVPQGRTIVVPVLNLFGAKDDCDGFMATAEGTAELDGTALTLERFTGVPIEVTAVAGNALGQEAGTFEALGCGIWARISAPAAGAHQLRIRGTSGNFAVSVDYDLTVA